MGKYTYKFKKSTYIILAVAMLIPIIILLFNEGIAWICFVFLLTLYVASLPFLVPALIISNILGFIFTDKYVMGIFLIIEAFVFIIYPVILYCLYQFGYYDMLM